MSTSRLPPPKNPSCLNCNAVEAHYKSTLKLIVKQTDKAIEVAREYRAMLEKAAKEVIALKASNRTAFESAREYFAKSIEAYTCAHATQTDQICVACAANLIRSVL